MFAARHPGSFALLFKLHQRLPATILGIPLHRTHLLRYSSSSNIVLFGSPPSAVSRLNEQNEDWGVSTTSFSLSTAANESLSFRVDSPATLV
jgi:hypothetical protein